MNLSLLAGEIEAYPPMPVIFFMTDNGLLVPYHMINTSPNCPSLVRPSTPIEREAERKRLGNIVLFCLKSFIV